MELRQKRSAATRVAALVCASALVLGMSAAVAAAADAASRPTVGGVDLPGDKPAGGSTVGIGGTGFTHVRKVLFGAKPATFRVDSRKWIVATVPPHAAGVVHVRVVTTAGTSAKNGRYDKFRYVLPPVVTSIKPDSGDPQGDVSIDMVGKHLRDVQSVTVGGQPATNLGSVPDDGHHARAVVPAMPQGTYDVVVTTAYGVSTADKNSRYRYVPSQQWRLVDPPGTDSGNSELYRPACSSNRCYAAGGHRSAATSTDSQPLLDVQQDDGSWTQANLAPPAGAGSFDNAAIGEIACAKQGLCVATGGDFQPDAGTRGALAFVGSDDEWVTSRPPFPSDDPDGSFTDDALACSKSKCVIFGKYQVGTSTRVVAEVWDDGTWTLHRSATLEDPKGSTRGKIFLTCPSDSVCVAAFRNGRKQLVAARITLDGASKPAVTYLPWKPVAAHHVLSSDGLGCISSSFCVFAATEYHPSGDNDIPDGPDHGFYELYLNGRWTRHQYALPTVVAHKKVSRHWYMNSLDCAPGGSCYAVGELYARSKAGRQQDGRGGAVVARISPSGARSVFPAVPDPYEGTTELRTVACALDSSCVVAGREVIDSPAEGRNDVFEFRDRLGTKDRPTIDRIPFSDRGSELLYWGVTCASAENCISSGINRDSTNNDSAWIAETVRPGQS